MVSRRWRGIRVVCHRGFADGQDLDAGIAGAVGGFVESGFSDFVEHGAEGSSQFRFIHLKERGHCALKIIASLSALMIFIHTVAL